MAGRPKSSIFLNFHDFGGFGGPIYWDLDQKSAKNPDTSSAFFVVFLVIFDPPYTGILVKNPVFRVKIAILGSKFEFFAMRKI